MEKFTRYNKCPRWFIALMLTALVAACGGGGEGRDPILGGGMTQDITSPTVALAAPAAGATGVAANAAVSATFSENINPATITATTFTVTGLGGAVITGTVSYDVATKTATFVPTTPAVLPDNTVLTATITKGVKDLAGNALANDFVWSFTTAPDAIAPSVASVNPVDLAANVCLQSSVTATFSEAMDATTVNGTTMTLQTSGPPLGAALGGTVTYDVASKSATFTPTMPLVIGTNYTATITTGAKDVTGNALVSNKVWTFTAANLPCAVPSASSVALGTAARFGNLGGTAGTTNTGILTTIGGDIGTTATVTSAVTGFHDTAGDIYTETGSNQGAVSGKIYTCTVSTLGPTSAAINPTSCTIANQGRADAQIAFDNLSPASLPGGVDPGAGQLGGLTLLPGTYKSASGSFQITGSDLVLDAQGDANAVWVFQTASTLTVGAPGAPRNISLINGALPKNVFWRVGTSATINAAGGGTMVGTILASSAVSFSTVGNVAIVTLDGRAIGLNASVTMTNTVVNVPAP